MIYNESHKELINCKVINCKGRLLSDLIVENELENNLVKYRKEGQIIASKNSWNPDFIDAPFPNEWEKFIPRSHGEILVGWHGNTIETAIIYTQAFLNYRRVKKALAEYHCYIYPKNTSTCQNLAGGGYDINIPERVLVGLKNKLQENRARKSQENRTEQLRLQHEKQQEQLLHEKQQADILNNVTIENANQTQLDNEKRNKALLLIGSLFLLG